MTDPQDAFDHLLRRQLATEPAPDDAGFSLRVMAALPATVPTRQQRWARWLTHARWVSVGMAAGGVAALLFHPGEAPDLPQAVAALVLVGLGVLWTLPATSGAT
ncbi:hypothetical protein [Pelomonas cellulosilytica]|uniref:Uncharacterized protein n=1 Tax=Pelomonas cellulosilytica TaxID=2906762 RepID=A0ABS8XRY1_9BURK|nr:hypothetical protein [Pelomonas sp. P8]MCE4553439.1 hypothetical protein [Pelomonas sp. P8]